MKPLLNTLYVTTEGAWLHKDGENLVMEINREKVARFPLHMIQGLVCFGRVSVSAPLLGYCTERGVCISYLSVHGKFQARVEGPVSGNVLLRRAQYRQTDNPDSCRDIVRNLIAGKVSNQRTVLSRALRDHRDTLVPGAVEKLEQAVDMLRRVTDKVRKGGSVDYLRGLEGEAAQRYFSVFDCLIRVDSPSMRFTGRSRRPPLDRVNALLSMLYTLLTHDCRSALETVGLDPAVGFLHRDRPGRPSLALDLMEEFRPVLADRLVLSLVNRKQIQENDFIISESGAVTLKEEARKKVLVAWQERKRETLMHQFVGETAEIGLFPLLQAQLLARHLRGDINGYPPFVCR